MHPVERSKGEDRLILFGLVGLFAITAFIFAIALYLSSGGVEG
jgi:hypothetical protein